MKKVYLVYMEPDDPFAGGIDIIKVFSNRKACINFVFDHNQDVIDFYDRYFWIICNVFRK